MSTSDHFSALPAGARVRDYAIERVLGSGGFGITYKAVEAITERAVAIKEYLPAALAARERDSQSVRPLSEGARQDFEWGLSRFRQEARVLIGLKHPNIVPVLSYFEANGTGYLVMEFEEGKSLGQMLGVEGVLSEKALLAYLAPLLDGLECVHRAGFLHRDIKPDNIFIRRDGAPVLIDFGAARQALGQHSKSLTAILTEGYAPYEQYERDGDQGPWTDIYALGAVMYRCLAGKRPIEAPKRIAARVRNAPDPLAVDLAALRGLASRHVADAVAAALGVTETERPQSVGAFRALLADASDHKAPRREHTLVLAQGAAAPAPASHETPPSARRRGWPVYLAAGALLAAGVATAGYLITDDANRAAQQTKAAEQQARQQRQAEAETQRKAEEAQRSKDEAERKRAEQERVEARRKAEEEQRAKHEAERKRLEDERARAEAERKRADEERAKAEAEAKRKAEEDRAKADADTKRSEEEAARKAGPAANAPDQMRVFSSVFERVRTSYVDDLGDKRLVETAIAALHKAIETPGVAPPSASWRHDLDRAAGTAGLLEVFSREFGRAHTDHAGRFGGYRLVHKVIGGTLQSLDVHSSFVDADAYKEMQVQTRGEFGGLGMEVTLEGGLVKVVAPIDDTPAHKAGIRSGDFITHIEGGPVEGWTLAQAVAKLRGPPNTNVLLRIKRGYASPFDLTLTRAVIVLKPVRARIEGNIGIIRITSFSERTDAALREALATLKTKLGDKWAGVILDIRNNPGGLLDQAVAVADEFLDQGEIISIRGRSEKVTSRFNAKKGDAAEGRPILILINKGTASAAEIVTTALQDHRRAVVIGSQSFGKGSVQTIIPIPEHGAMRLTTARYFGPLGKSIDKVGITPDIVVDGEPTSTTDAQMERALKWFAERK